MMGMAFAPFLALLVLGLVGAFVLHVLARYRVLTGVDGFLGKWAIGWLGAWLGSPVFGHWGAQLQNTYIVPALLGAFVGPFLITALFKAYATAATAVPQRVAVAPAPSVGTQFEMRKVS